MLIREITIPVGAEKPFSALHTSDNHISLADERDDARKIELAENRANAFTGGNPSRLNEQVKEIFGYAKQHNLPLLHTGDLVDFVSEANLDFVRQLMKDADVFCAAGNHDFSLYVGEAWEDEAYKAQSLQHVKSAYPGDFQFQVRVMGGVKFIALDNNYYYVTPSLFERFRKETQDGMPTVLLVHNPLYSEDIYRQYMKDRPEDFPPYLFGCPERLLRKLSDYRYRQQKPDALSLEFLRYVETLPCLKAVLSGHAHVFMASRLDSGVPQYVAGAGYAGDVNLYTFV